MLVERLAVWQVKSRNITCFFAVVCAAPGAWATCDNSAPKSPTTTSISSLLLHAAAMIIVTSSDEANWGRRASGSPPRDCHRLGGLSGRPRHTSRSLPGLTLPDLLTAARPPSPTAKTCKRATVSLSTWWCACTDVGALPACSISPAAADLPRGHGPDHVPGLSQGHDALHLCLLHVLVTPAYLAAADEPLWKPAGSKQPSSCPCVSVCVCTFTRTYRRSLLTHLR